MKLIYFWKAFLWFGIICYALFIPASELPSKSLFSIPHFDKLVHFLLFFGLCILLYRPIKKLNLKYSWLAPVIALIIAFILEVLQQKIAVSRSSDFYDFLANTFGIIAAALFFQFCVSGKKWEILF